METQTETLTPQPLPEDLKAHFDKFDLALCMSCGSCSSGCATSGAPGYEEWNTRKVLRLLALGQFQELVDHNFPWLCTGCGRCSYNCPMGIDIVPIMAHLKHLRPREKTPGTIHKGMLSNLETGNNLAIPLEDYLEGMIDLGAQMADEDCPGFYVPVDKKDADILFFPNSKEVFGDFEDQFWWWRIFYAAKENWTVPSEGWEAVDWALFSANYEGTRKLAQRKIDIMKDLNIGRMIMPDCGGGSYGCRAGLKNCIEVNEENAVDFVYLYEYLKELFEQGRIKVDKSVHAGKLHTWHDSCKHGRELDRHYGQAFFEEARWVLSQCVDDFIELQPNRAANYCCGAGGGNWPMPFEDQSAHHARFKADQLRRSKAEVIVVGCSNCRDQIMKRLPKYYPDLQYEVKYLWQIIAEALIIEPWPDDEIAKAEAEAKAQWERFGIDPEEVLNAY